MEWCRLRHDPQAEKDSLLQTIATLEADKERVRGELEQVRLALEKLQAAEVVRAVVADAPPQHAAAASRARRAEEEAAKARAEAKQARGELAVISRCSPPSSPSSRPRADLARSPQARAELAEAKRAQERAAAEAGKVSEVYATYQKDKKMLGRAVQLQEEEKGNS